MRLLGIVVALLGALAATQAQQPRVIAIRNVTVVSGDPAVAQPAMTVLLRGERIAAIGPAAEVMVPAGAASVDGTGHFLIPGLIDLHVHMSKARASAFSLLIVNGVTAIRDMGGEMAELLAWRTEIEAGRRVGPRMIVAGPYLESVRNIERMRKDPPSERVEPFEKTRIGVGSPADARRIVAELASQQVDFLKIRTVADRDTYFALNAAARAHGLKLVGHVSGIPPDVVLQAGQAGIDHTFDPSLEGSKEQRMTVWRQFANRSVPCVPTLVTAFETTSSGATAAGHG